MSKHTSSNNDGQQENRYDQYCPIDVTWDAVGPGDRQMGFHSKPPKPSLLAGRRYLGSMRSVLIDVFLK